MDFTDRFKQALELRRIPSSEIRRRFDYDRKLLVNDLLVELESESRDLITAVTGSGLSIGYPAWNLLYYSLLCSLPAESPVVLETGTNHGISTVVMAQALEDAASDAMVRTVDADAEAVEIARRNVARAGLEHRVELYLGDSLYILQQWVAEVDHADFVFLDGDHSKEHVLEEFTIVHPRVKSCGGKVYFDNTASGGVREALDEIRRLYGGNLIDFPNCSWGPPGNALWQA